MMEPMDGVDSGSGSGSGSDDRVREWEEGLPSVGELTPLSQCLISPQLASAFSITSDIPPYRSLADVNCASQTIFDILRGMSGVPSVPFADPNHDAVPVRAFWKQQDQALPKVLTTPSNLLRSHAQQGELPEAKSDGGPEPGEVEAEGEAFASAAPSPGRTDSSEGVTGNEADAEAEEAESAPVPLENPYEDPVAPTLKRPRLVWTPELHKRFVEAVAHLGIKNAVPKTIMQLMNVEGLTRENVASHLQKYRHYLKRMQGLSTEGPTSSDHLFASTPVPPSFAASTRFYAGIPAHLEDIMQVPFTASHCPRGHVPGTANVAGTLAPVDPFSYKTFARPPPHRFVQGDQREAHGIKQNQSASTSHHVLRLFPTGKK